MKFVAEVIEATGLVQAVTQMGDDLPPAPSGRFFVELDGYHQEHCGKRYEFVDGQHTFTEFPPPEAP